MGRENSGEIEIRNMIFKASVICVQKFKNNEES